MDWFQIGKGVHQGCIFSPCLFTLYAEYTMRNAGLNEAQIGIKIAGRNINNLRYADDTTLMAENHGKLMGKQCQTLFFGAPKSLQMVTVAMKLKDAYSLEGKL